MRCSKFFLQIGSEFCLQLFLFVSFLMYSQDVSFFFIHEKIYPHFDNQGKFCHEWKKANVVPVFKIFLLIIWSCGKNGLIRKIRLISKLTMSQPGQQTIAIYILLLITQSKDDQTMKFGQLLEYNKIFFFRIYAQTVVGRLVSDLFLFFRKTLWEVKASALSLSFNIF